jgi:hypothetical protein
MICTTELSGGRIPRVACSIPTAASLHDRVWFSIGSGGDGFGSGGGAEPHATNKNKGARDRARTRVDDEGIDEYVHGRELT